MICLRCGLCCYTMDVIIRVGDHYYMKPGGAICPHLDLGDKTCTCRVHDEPWYQDMPCFTYGNSDIDPDFICKRGKPCHVGEHVLQHGGLPCTHPDARVVENMEELGPCEDSD